MAATPSIVQSKNERRRLAVCRARVMGSGIAFTRIPILHQTAWPA